MKRVLLLSIAPIAIVGSVLSTDTPFSRVWLNLIVLGIIPGTNFRLNFLLTVLLTIFGFVLLVRWFKQVSYQLVEYKLTRFRRRPPAKNKRTTLERTPSNKPLIEDLEIEVA